MTVRTILATWARRLQRRAIRTTLFTVLALVALACGDEAQPFDPPSFERPAGAAFLCAAQAESGGLPQPVSSAMCRGEQDVPEGVVARRFALVAQTSRGEVAAVNLNEARILDSDVRVPGFTFVPVGEAPTAVAVPQERPETTYVANFGSKNLMWIDTSAFLGIAVDPQQDWPSTALPSGPVALAYVPDADPGGDVVVEGEVPVTLEPADRLFVSLPESHAIAAFRVRADGSLGATLGERPVDLNQLISLPSEVVPPEPLDEAPDIQPAADLCASDAAPHPPAPPAPPRDPVFLATEPQPGQLLHDTAAGRLLIADEALPLVHVLDVETLELLPPIYTGVPVRALTLTPFVPTSDGEGETRYLYGIDATDGSVLVVEYTPACADTGTCPVLAVAGQTGRPIDRVLLPEGPIATALASIDTRDAGEVCPDPETDAGEQARDPANLRGVFVAVAMANGTVRIVDVLDRRLFDPEDPERAPCACLAAEGDPDVAPVSVYFRRHRPRIGVELETDEPFAELDAFVRSDGLRTRVRSTGSSGVEGAPVLASLDDCPDGTVRAFPEAAALDPETAPLVCVIQDPWQLTRETWVATWQGVLPGAQNRLGQIEADGTLQRLNRGTDFCSLGVLGADAIEALPGATPSAAGDQLVLTLDLERIAPETLEQSPRCQALFGEGEDGERPMVAFEILEARRDRLQLAERASQGDARLEEVLDCLPDGLVTYEIRVRQAYTVIGTSSGYLHSVIAEEDGACVVDIDEDATVPERIGRAFPGEVELEDGPGAFLGTAFDNGILAFQVTAPDTTFDDLAFELAVFDAPVPLAVQLGTVSNNRVSATLPTTLLFSDLDDRLYAVDIVSQGLVPIELDDFSVSADIFR